MRYWKEYYLNGVEVNARLDTKTHRWEIWLGSMNGPNQKHWRDPDLIFTKAKGQSVVEFLDSLKDTERKNQDT